MEAAVAAPPSASEIETNPPAPASSEPAIVVPPTPPPAADAAAAAKADLTAPVDREKAARGGTTPEKTTPAEKTTPKEQQTPPKEEKKAAAVQPAEVKEEKAAPSAEQIKEEELTKEEVEQIGKMTPKEMRAVFKARNKAERLAESRGVELEKALKEVKKIATLEATIKELEKRPTTEANDAKIAAANSELDKRRADMDAAEKTLKDREGHVKLREYATDATKTEDYQTYVAKPIAKLQKDLGLLCRGATADDEAANGLYSQIITALKNPDEAERWREVKKAIVDADSSDKAKFAGIHDTWNQILSNEAAMLGESEKAKITVEKDIARKTEAQKKETISRFKAAETTAKTELEKTIKFLTIPLDQLPPEYQKIRTEWAQQEAEFDPNNVTPETTAALFQMAGSFQIATVVARDHINKLKDNEKTLEAKLAEVTKELEEFKAGKKAVEDEEEKEEKESDEVAPNVETGKDGPSRVPSVPLFTPGESAGSGFTKHVFASDVTS